MGDTNRVWVRNVLTASLLALALLVSWLISSSEGNNVTGSPVAKQESRDSLAETTKFRQRPMPRKTPTPGDKAPFPVEGARFSGGKSAIRNPASSKSATRTHQRRYADTVRRRAAQEKRTSEEEQRAARTVNSDRANPPEPPPATEKEQLRRRKYLGRAIREQYFPVARSCYDELLSRQPTAAGKIVMSFDIVGFADTGVVDQVELKDDSTIDDPEFELCMRESMYTAVFDAPPPGTERATIVYPIELNPGGG